MTEKLLFVAPNSYVVRNWIASGLADLCQDELNLEPVFVSHFSDPVFYSSQGRAFRNYEVAAASIIQREVPADFPKVLYALYHLRLRTAALEITDGSFQLMQLARRRDALHYLIRLGQLLLPRGSVQRGWARRLVDSINPVHAACAATIEQVDPRALVVGSPGFLLLDQLMLVEAQRRHLPTYCVVNSWDNMTSRGSMIRRPDSLMVWNEHMRDQAQRLHQYPAQQTHVVGSLQFTRYAEPVTEAETGALYQRLGLPPGSPYLLVLTGQHIPEYEAEDVAVLLKTLADGEYRDWPVVVRIHPQASNKPFAAIRDARLVLDCPPKFTAKGAGGALFDVSEIRAMAALLKNARLVISSWGTTALLEAAIFDRPIVQLRWMDAFPRAYPEQAVKVHDFQRYLHLIPFDATNCRVFSDTPASLASDLQRLISEDALFRERRQQAVNSLVCPPLAEASHRVVRLLAAALGR